MAQPAGQPEPTGPCAAFAPPPTMAAPVPGQTFEVRARLANRGGMTSRRSHDRRVAARSAGDPADDRDVRRRRSRSSGHEQCDRSASPCTLAADAPISHASVFPRAAAFRRAATRSSDPSQFGRPASRRRWSPWRATSSTACRSKMRETVRRREAKLPYGDVLREVQDACRGWRSRCRPANAIVPLAARPPSASNVAGRRRLTTPRRRNSGSVALTAARGLDVRAGVAAVHVRARRRAASYPLHGAPVTI